MSNPGSSDLLALPEELQFALSRLFQDSRHNLHFRGSFSPAEADIAMDSARVGDFIHVTTADQTSFENKALDVDYCVICVQSYDSPDDRTAANFVCINGNAQPKFGSLNMEDNAVATTISMSGTWVKVSGVTTGGTSVGFDSTTVDNRITYTGVLTKPAVIHIGLSAIKVIADSRSYEFAVCKNATTQLMAKSSVNITDSRAENITLVVVDPVMVTGDFYELFVRNIDNTDDPIIQNLNIVVTVPT